MAAESRSASLIVMLRQYLLRLLHGGFLRHALAKWVKKLAFLGYFLSFRRVSLRAQRGKATAGTPPPDTPSSKAVGSTPSKERSALVRRPSESEGYLDISNGEIVSLDNAAFSLYPSSESDSLNRLSTSWGQLRLQPYTERRSETSGMRSASTYYHENVETTSREEMHNTFSNYFLLSQSASFTRLNHPRIKPIPPQCSRRYLRKQEQKEQKKAGEKSKTTATSNAERRPPPGWAVYTHPEGARYFCNKDKRIFTDADLYDHNIFKQTLEDISVIEEFISQNNITLPRNSDLVIDLFYSEKDQVIQTFYYYVHHASRSIFFLDIFEPDKSISRHISKSESNLRDEIEAQYWLHLQLFPHAAPISTSLIRELRDKTFYFIEEYTTSTSNSIYTLDELYKTLSLTDNFERNIGNESSGAVSLLARLMHSFALSKISLQESKKNSDLQIQDSESQVDQRTWFIRIASPLLLFAPDLYYQGQTIHALCVHRITTIIGSDWLEILLFATLLLIVNVVFLGIHLVDLDHTPPHRSPAQVSSYASAVLSIGSIILGLVFFRQTKLASRGVSVGIETRSRIGREILAIIHSLPYVLLMWSIIAFTLAFSFLCFQRSSKLNRILLGTFGGIVFVLVILSTASSWVLGHQHGPAFHATESCSKGAPQISRPAFPSKLPAPRAQLPNSPTEAINV
ncbi:hypothetical protein CPB84DRAFT_1850522 [Gymnopilus junonius]|uniref:Uncharacterized protein n=1 Tax=Gymnopilus junonius TaxID=109634 RepID=A0A9P5TJF1_GYMJU|nr:hypothetical protein CPB84DRAFT_1850522 [Gymnopilus junonius]